ncbi:MAG: HAMP domain-containing protein [Chromatiaceae bacterium]|nr:HAMP domain-containing protein [Chromatiaceae bacterium]
MVFQDVTAGYLTVSIDRSPLEQDIRDTLRFLVVSAVLLTSLGVMLASVLAHRLSRPIEHLARAGEALNAGRQPRLAGRRDEIGQVLETFQHLAAGVQRQQPGRGRAFTLCLAAGRQQQLADDANIALGGSSVVGSVLFCDIVGFTQLSESRQPAEVVAPAERLFRLFRAGGRELRRHGRQVHR